ncbi:MAG: hypothetical protein H0V17_15080, partial [Deltaproteobacteria bacterium]|nr:hypothetical protein [Deltaproteobacteria bacterium]
MRPRLWAIAILGGAWWVWPSEPERVSLDLQAAVTSNGFAIIERHSARVFETDLKGAPTGDRQTPKLSEDTRVIGTRIGAALVWKAGKRIAIAPIDHTDERELFGRRVEKLCSQTASSQLGFGIAWIESDGDLWFVHGPTAGTATTARVPSDQDHDDVDEAAPPYCGISRADGPDSQLAMLWRNGSRTELIRCGKRCSTPRKVAIATTDAILGFSCSGRFCLIATRDRAGAATLHWLNDKAKTIGKQPLAASQANGAACVVDVKGVAGEPHPDACGVVIAGEGERFAIAYSNGPDPIVELSEAPGKLRRVWSGGDPNT